MNLPTYTDLAEQIKRSIAQHKNWRIEDFIKDLLSSAGVNDADENEFESDLFRALIEAFKSIDNPRNDKKLARASKSFSSLLMVPLVISPYDCITKNFNSGKPA